MMRNLFMLTTAGLGAYWMGQKAMALGAAMSKGAAAGADLGGLFVVPAVLLGLIGGAILGGLLYPGRLCR